MAAGTVLFQRPFFHQYRLLCLDYAILDVPKGISIASTLSNKFLKSDTRVILDDEKASLSLVAVRPAIIVLESSKLLSLKLCNPPTAVFTFRLRGLPLLFLLLLYRSVCNRLIGSKGFASHLWFSLGLQIPCWWLRCFLQNNWNGIYVFCIKLLNDISNQVMSSNSIFLIENNFPAKPSQAITNPSTNSLFESLNRIRFCRCFSFFWISC